MIKTQTQIEMADAVMAAVVRPRQENPTATGSFLSPTAAAGTPQDFEQGGDDTFEPFWYTRVRKGAVL